MSEMYKQGWADYRSALYLSDEEIQIYHRELLAKYQHNKEK